MAERYNSVLRYDVLAVCRTAFRTGNESNYGGGVLRDDSGTLLLRGGGIRGAMRKWVQEQADREDFERLFGGERLRFSDGVFFPETSVNVPWENVRIAAQCVDMFYIDCKDTDPDIYRRYTGKDNAQMLDNLRKLLLLVGP